MIIIYLFHYKEKQKHWITNQGKWSGLIFFQRVPPIKPHSTYRWNPRSAKEVYLLLLIRAWLFPYRSCHYYLMNTKKNKKTKQIFYIPRLSNSRALYPTEVLDFWCESLMGTFKVFNKYKRGCNSKFQNSSEVASNLTFQANNEALAW